MAEVKISNLTAATEVAAADTLVIVQGGTTKRATFAMDFTVTGAWTMTSIAGAAIATQAQQETGTSVINAVSPGRQHYHPSAAKFWVMWNGTGTTILASYNVTSITNSGTGDEVVTIATDFSSAAWAGFLSSNAPMNEVYTNVAAGTVQCVTRSSSGTVTDAIDNVVGFGDQA